MSAKHITILIKPASSACNLKCRYCFYNDVSSLREVRSFGLMSEKTSHNLIDKALDFADGGSVNFAFQGGEPTICPLDFFKDFVEYCKSANKKNSRVSYSLQTNGTLLTDEMAAFYAKNDFLIGVSIDGKAELHNANRLTSTGKGSFNKVMQGIDLLKKHNVKFNVLIVANKFSAKRGRETYRFFKSQGINYMQFIDCLEPFDVEPFTSGFSMNNDEYFNYYKSIFDEYINDITSGEDIYVRSFENILTLMSGGTPEICGMKGYCTVNLVVEGNGNCYPCDFYCEDEYLLGNINENDLEELALSKNADKFVKASFKVEEKCKTCEVAGLCMGGCRRERDVHGEITLNRYCEGKKKLLTYMLQKIRALQGR